MAYTPEERLAARRASQRRYAEANREKAAAYREANRERYREYFRQYNKLNAETISEKNRRRYLADPEPAKARARRIREADPDAYRRRQREGRAARREIVREQSRVWREANRERVLEQRRQWHAANPDAAQRYANDRRGLRAGAASERWTTLEILERDGWTCRIPDCRCPAGRAIDPAAGVRTPWSGAADHIQPMNKGGSNLKSNMQAAHMACNGAKSDRWNEAA
jgi:hypothetical protein